MFYLLHQQQSASSTCANIIGKTKTWSTEMMSSNKSSAAEINTTKSNDAATSTLNTNIITKMIGDTNPGEKGLKLKV